MLERVKDLTNRKFVRLTVLKRDHSYYKESRWICLCKCGNTIIVRKSSLLSGNTRSCGCLSKEASSKRALERNKIEYGLAAKREIYRNYVYSAKRRNLSFELSFEQLLNLVQQNCHYCGSPPLNNTGSKRKKNGDFIYNGIDRKDNMKGYLMENCVTCCNICNRAKYKMSYNEFMEWISKLKRNNL